ncbi:MAG: NAD(P)H-dependent oxidoreductase [Bacteroidota bacterium]
MAHIAIISPSLRIGRLSHRAALYFKSYLEDNNLASAEIIDLKEYNFPLFTERLKFTQEPIASAIEFSDKIKSADAVIIVTPEYNGGYPASLKNAIDLLYEEWYHKPVAVSTVSSGNFGGVQVIMQLQFILWKMKAFTVPAVFPVPNIGDVLDEKGMPTDKAAFDRRAASFLKELIWFTEATDCMKIKKNS